MPVIPSFSSFAATPDIAGALSAADRNANEATQIALTFAAAQQRMRQEADIARERIAAEQVDNQMRLQAQKEIADREHARRQQEAEIEKSYREMQLGIAKRKLDTDEEAAAWKIDEAAREMQRHADYGRLQKQYEGEALSRGIPATEAAQEGARRALFETGGTGMASAFENKSGTPQRFNAVTEVDQLGLRPPTRLPMDQQQFGRFMETAPPELKTNATNVAIERMLPPLSIPSTLTGTNPSGALPLPKDKAELKTGQRYMTSRGEAVWDGNKFVK